MTSRKEKQERRLQAERAERDARVMIASFNENLPAGYPRHWGAGPDENRARFLDHGKRLAVTTLAHFCCAVSS